MSHWKKSLALLCTGIMITCVAGSNSPILEPDFYDFSISYTWQCNEVPTVTSMTGRFIELVNIPRFELSGPSRFTDGTIASQVITISFKALWHFTADYHDNEHTLAGANDLLGECSLSFALTEDGSRWRFFSGTFPGAWVAPGEGMIVRSGYHGVCLGAGLGIDGDLSGNLNNKLEYEASRVSEGPPISSVSFSQGLSTSECISEYPVFSLVSGYRRDVRYDTIEGYRKFGCAIVLLSGRNDSPAE